MGRDRYGIDHEAGWYRSAISSVILGANTGIGSWKKSLAYHARDPFERRVSSTHMDGILNEITRTVHKRQVGDPGVTTACGISYHVDPEQLVPIAIDRANSEVGAEKCGRCFEDAGGY